MCLSNRNPLILLFFLSAFFSPSIGGDTITPTHPLADGQTLISADGSFALGFFSPSGTKNRYVGIWYNKVSIKTVVWVANRQHPIADPTGILSISGNGRLAITVHNSTKVWSTPASAATNSVAQLLDSGNFVIREANTGDPVSFRWESFDHPTDTMLPGMKVGWNLTSGLNRNLTSWTSESDPSPGPYTYGMDVRGDSQVFLWAGATGLWRLGSWNGLRFSGFPYMDINTITTTFTYEFIANDQEVYYSCHIRNSSIISRFIVDLSGQVKRLVWIDSSRSWILLWFAPMDPCDNLSRCGPYGICNLNDSPICKCLQGFDPKPPALTDGSDGCVRRTALDCRNGTDGFLTVGSVKLPDTSGATVDRRMSLDECRAACLGNCSCKAYASANISGNGSGCIIWTTGLTDLRVYDSGGQDLYLRLAAADLGLKPNRSHGSGIVRIAIMGGLIPGVLILGCIIYCIWKKMMKKREEQRKRRAIEGITIFSNHYDDESVQGEDLELPLFDLGTIAVATDNFSSDNKIGEGGFGPVYKGKLGEGIQIAVKRLSRTSGQGVREFKNEVMLIAKLQHRNLVRLLGCCVQGGERMLIYEYMHNKSLDVFLFDKAKHVKLDWTTRYNIILGIARGLLYLHQDSRLRIIHRDLKPSNILLDEEMTPKVSDFGLARIFGGDEPEVNTKKVAGTYGYMSPEYVIEGIFSVKSDVFSFGVLVLEIISGKKNRGASLPGNSQYLLTQAWNLWKSGNSLELVDDSIGDSFSPMEALRLINVGLLCVQERPEDRPTMAMVGLMMSSGSLPPPKKPGFVATSDPFDVETIVNEISVTMLEGR